MYICTIFGDKLNRMFFKRFIKGYNTAVFNRKLERKLADNELNFTAVKELTIGCVVDEKFCEIDFLKDRLSSLFQIPRINVQLLRVDSVELEDKMDKVALNAIEIDRNKAIDHPEVKFFMSRPYRILLNLYTVEHPVLNWITVHANCTFRIGLGSIDHRQNDLIITMETYDPEIIFKELERYRLRLDILQ